MQNHFEFVSRSFYAEIWNNKWNSKGGTKSGMWNKSWNKSTSVLWYKRWNRTNTLFGIKRGTTSILDGGTNSGIKVFKMVV